MTTLLRLLVLAACLALAPFTTAQEAAPKPADKATLVIANRPVFVFRSGLAGYTAQDRADAARVRIERAADAAVQLIPATRPIAEGTQVLLGGHLLFLVTPADINTLAGDTTDSVARDSADELARALRDRREQSSVRHLLIAGGLCVGATLLYALALRVLTLLHRRVRAGTERLLHTHLDRLRIRNVPVLDPGHAIRFLGHVAGATVWGLRILATVLWLTFLLAEIPHTRGWGERLRDYLLANALEAARAVAESVPGLLLVAAIVAVARLAIVSASALFRRVERGELKAGWLDRDTAAPTRRIVNVVIVLFALAMAYPYLPGSHTAAFQGVTVLAGLMVSIGASSIVGQGASGLILIYTRALRRGEFVRIGDTEGTVVDVGMFAARIRTGFGEEITIPNAFILGNTVRNFSRARPGTGFVLDTKISVGYDVPWRQVHALLLHAAAATPGIAAEPSPIVAQTALSDWYIEYKLIAYVTFEVARERAEVLTQLHQNIVDEFNVHGVEITSPHYIQEQMKSHIVPPDAWFAAPAERTAFDEAPARKE